MNKFSALLVSALFIVLSNIQSPAAASSPNLGQLVLVGGPWLLSVIGQTGELNANNPSSAIVQIAPAMVGTDRMFLERASISIESLFANKRGVTSATCSLLDVLGLELGVRVWKNIDARAGYNLPLFNTGKDAYASYHLSVGGNQISLARIPWITVPRVYLGNSTEGKFMQFTLGFKFSDKNF